MDYTGLVLVVWVFVYTVFAYIRREQLHRETVRYVMKGIRPPDRTPMREAWNIVRMVIITLAVLGGSAYFVFWRVRHWGANPGPYIMAGAFGGFCLLLIWKIVGDLREYGKLVENLGKEGKLVGKLRESTKRVGNLRKDREIAGDAGESRKTAGKLSADGKVAGDFSEHGRIAEDLGEHGRIAGDNGEHGDTQKPNGEVQS